MVGLALFTALVVVLQMLGSFIRFGAFSVTLVLIPIVVGAALYGWKAGAWLGFVFAFVVLVSGDANLFFAISPLGTILTVVVKGAAAGAAAGLVYRLFQKKDTWLAIFSAALLCPLTNTGVFLIGCRLFFWKAIADMGAAEGFSGSVFKYVLIFFVGGNFLFEVLFNLVLGPVIFRLIRLGKKE